MPRWSVAVNPRATPLVRALPLSGAGFAVHTIIFRLRRVTVLRNQVPLRSGAKPARGAQPGLILQQTAGRSHRLTSAAKPSRRIKFQPRELVLSCTLLNPTSLSGLRDVVLNSV